MNVEVLTSKDERGEERLARLLPQLKKIGFQPIINYIDLGKDPMEAIHESMINICNKNKDNNYYIYVEDDAIIDPEMTMKDFIKFLADNGKDSASILSFGSHNYGQFKVKTPYMIELDRAYSLQFLIVYKKGYELIKEMKLEVEQDRYIQSKLKHSIRTIIPYPVIQDNLLGSRIKRYSRDEEDFLGRYMEQMKKSIEYKYCKTEEVCTHK